MPSARGYAPASTGKRFHGARSSSASLGYWGIPKAVDVHAGGTGSPSRSPGALARVGWCDDESSSRRKNSRSPSHGSRKAGHQTSPEHRRCRSADLRRRHRCQPTRQAPGGTHAQRAQSIPTNPESLGEKRRDLEGLPPGGDCPHLHACWPCCRWMGYPFGGFRRGTKATPHDRDQQEQGTGNKKGQIFPLRFLPEMSILGVACPWAYAANPHE